MIFERHTLQKPIDDYIESIFHYKGFKPDHNIERVVPTGHIFILFELDGIPRNTFDNITLEPNDTFTKVWVSGMHKNYLSISAPQDSEMLVIQFKPAGALPFFNSPIYLINDKVVPAESLFGKEILQLQEKILEQNTSAEKFRVVDDWLLNRFDASAKVDPEVANILNKLSTNPFYVHKEIVRSYPKTHKSLISQFKKHIGLTPKVLHRIFRFNEILQKIHLKESLDWPQIAYQFGYTDQSHFIKEFKEFSGFSPQEFIDSDFQKDQPNFFPLDREG